MKRGQASVEYISTYAWAFLALVLTVGALSYFGVLDADSYINENCELGSQVECIDIYADSQGEIYIQVKNNYAKEIFLDTVEVTNFEGVSGDSSVTMRILPGNSATAVYSTGIGLNEGDKQNIDFNMVYRRYPNGQPHQILGTAVAEVQDATVTASLGYCGDGILQTGEECDPITVRPMGGYGSSSECNDYECVSDCTCNSLCGNGIIDGPETDTGRCDPEAEILTCNAGEVCSDTCYCQTP